AKPAVEETESEAPVPVKVEAAETGSIRRGDDAGCVQDPADGSGLGCLDLHRDRCFAFRLLDGRLRAASHQGDGEGEDNSLGVGGHGRGAPMARSRSESAVWN